MQVINRILFYSESELNRIKKQGKNLFDKDEKGKYKFLPKKKFYDTRNIDENFYERTIEVKEKGKAKPQTVRQKFENQPGPNRAKRRFALQSAKKRGTDFEAFDRKVKKRRGVYTKPKVLTSRQWISKLYRAGTTKKEIRKMHNECRNETGSRLSYKTFSTYVTEAKK